MKELAKTYDPGAIEECTYQKWMGRKYFHAKVDKTKKPFTIVIPPPNVTGKLHMGHALDETLQDILIRYKRMQGYNALWVPGTDHASISTEVKVTNQLRGRGHRQTGTWKGRLFKTGLAVERGVWRGHHQPVKEAGFLLRLGPGAFYHGRGLFGGSAGSVHPPV